MTDQGGPHISVIIPHYNDLRNLGLCLDRLDRQTLARDRFEIIVADNNSPVGADAVRIIAAGRAMVVVAPEQGAGPARNAGVAVATGHCLAFIDSDCRPDPDWLARGVAALNDFDVAGGKVRVDVESPPDITPVEAFELVFAFQNKTYVERKGFSVSANLFVRRATFETAGPFRNGVSEDVEWCHRATRRGARLGYAGDAVVGHPARRDWPELRQKLKRLTREMYKLSREQRFGRLRWIGRSFIVLASPFAHVFTVAFSPRLERSKDRVGAAAILFLSRTFRFMESCRAVLRLPEE